MEQTIPQDLQENQVIDHDSLHRYRTEIPNILLDMGLEPLALVLYLHLKRIAGDKGKCWVSNPELAKKTYTSDSSVRRYKKFLAKKGLIKCTPRKKENSKENDTDLIEIMDLWPYNFEHFKQKKDRKEVVSEKTDGGVTENGRGVTENGKEELKKKNISKEEYKESKKEKGTTPLKPPSSQDVPKNIVKKNRPNLIKVKENIWLTPEELEKLKNLTTEQNLNSLLEDMEDYQYARNKPYANHYRALLKWIRNQFKSQQRKGPDNFSDNKWEAPKADATIEL